MFFYEEKQFKIICWHKRVQFKISTIIEFGHLIIKIIMFYELTLYYIMKVVGA